MSRTPTGGWDDPSPRADPSVTEAVVLDRSEPMLEAARARFAGVPGVTVGAHDLSGPIGDVGVFDVVVSGLAIHHLTDERKAGLYAEALGLRPPSAGPPTTPRTASPRSRTTSPG